MSEAWISGQAGRAVVDTGEKMFLLVDGDEGPPEPCSPRHLSVVWSTYGDIVRKEADEYRSPGSAMPCGRRSPPIARDSSCSS
ncbi:MAG TPA: hypothetical protein VIK91_17115 [Nannocystis sp.]